MRFQRLPAIWVTAALLGLPGTAAFADVTPTPQATPKIDPYKVAQEQFKKDRDAYVAALKERELKMREINTAFKIAIDKAAVEAKGLMNVATTPEKKNGVASSRRSAIAAAIVARESAISALGPLPTPPVEPIRPAKSEEKSKQKR